MFLQDIRYALRMLRKNPGFSVIAVATLALGIGANAVILTVVNAVLLRPLPLPEGDRIVRLQEQHTHVTNLTGATFHDVRERNHVFADVAAYRIFSQNLADPAHTTAPEEIDTAFVSQDFLSLVRTRPFLGSGFSEVEFKEGAEQAVLLSYSLWQHHFGSNLNIVGKPVVLHGEARLVIGVMPAEFSFPEQVQAWVPLTEQSSLPQNRRAHLFTTLARIKPGVAIAAVNSDLQTIVAAIQQENYNVDPDFNFSAQSLKVNIVSSVRPALLLLLGAVGFVLLIACANVANLLLSRSVARQKEIALRTVLGADRLRLVRQLLTENLVLGFGGGVLGCLAGFGAAKILVTAYPDAIPRLNNLSLDLPSILFVLCVSLLSAIFFGIFPALQLSKVNLQEQLAHGGRTTGSVVRHRMRSSLVIGEVALAMILLTGAGLLIRSFVLLQRVDPGYQASHLLVASVTLPDAHYNDTEQRLRFVNSVLERVRAVPGIRNAAVAGSLPLRPVAETDFDLEGRNSFPGEEPSAQVLTATPGYFQAMGIRLLTGRTFTSQDVLGRPTAVVINQTMAKRYWSRESPLGKKIVMKDWGPPLPGEIVGVVADVSVDSLDTPPQPAVYYSFAQFEQGTLTTFLIARTASAPSNFSAALRSQVWAVDKEQPVSVFTMDQVISESLQRRRFLMTLLGSFAGLALVLAIIGVYGIVAYSVEQRTHEFGIRLSLGAQRHEVLLLVLKQGLATVVIGLGIGLIAALALTRLLRGMLFEVSPADPLTFSLIPLLLVGVALLASYVPAMRAAKLDPMEALRYE